MRRMTHIPHMLWIVAILAVFTISVAEDRDCPCPKHDAGWAAYPDTATGAPDFFALPYVDVKSILVCAHAVHFFFEAVQDSQETRACLVYNRPSVELYLDALPEASFATVGEAQIRNFERNVERALPKYTTFSDSLALVMGKKYKTNEPMKFRKGFRGKLPQVYIGPPLQLHYKKDVITLEGRIDVFFENP